MSMKITQISFLHFFSRPQIDCHDSGTESDGDLDTEDFHDRDIELSKWNDLDLIKVFNQLIYAEVKIILIFHSLFRVSLSAFEMNCHFVFVSLREKKRLTRNYVNSHAMLTFNDLPACRVFYIQFFFHSRHSSPFYSNFNFCCFSILI